MSDMKIVESKDLGEKYYKIKHSTGLTIYVMPKENYSSSFAVFATKYGSIDTKFKSSNSNEWTVVPEGIAHFLEHKLFESEEQDAFARFAQTGASANAYTSFDRTCYLFRSSDKFYESLEILLDFVTHPYFTKETVEKEQGIIGQEITMYYDVPGWMSTFNLLKLLYRNHPVRIDIAGTVESISQITDKLLYDCYNTFYNLNNMCLAVAGDVDVNRVIALCDKNLKTAPPLETERSFEAEPDEIAGSFCEYNLSMSMPVFSFGYKEKCESPIQSIRTVIETNILLEILAGDTSPLYNSLFRQGLINTTFSKEYFIGYGYEAVIFDGESSNPQRVGEEIKKAVAELKKNGIDDSQFEAVRRMMYGREIMEYNDIDNIANGLISAEFNGYSPFEAMEIYKSVTKEDIEKRLAEMMREEYSALSVVKDKSDVKDI